MAVQLFLSCVSDEFGVYRDALRSALTRPNVEVKIQEDFKAPGGDTPMKFEAYIRRCEAVVHFVGDMTGSAPPAFSVDELLARRPDLKTRLPPLGAALDAGDPISYTQWEAWLALFYRKDLVIAAPAPGVKPDRSSRRSSLRRRIRGSAGGASGATEGDGPLSPKVHDRQSRCANFCLGGHRRAGQSGGDAWASAPQSAFRLARAPVHGPR